MNYTLLHMQRKMHALTGLGPVNGFYRQRKALGSIKFGGHQQNLRTFILHERERGAGSGDPGFSRT